MKLVIFDCDGTLVDSQDAICGAMVHAFTALGLAPPARHQVLQVVGLSLGEAFAVLAQGQSPAAQARLAALYREAFPVGAAGPIRRDPLFAGAKDVVEALARRDDVILGIATGKSRRGVARLFEHEGWHGHFHTVQTADDHPSKPHPSMIEAAMREAGAGPDATVMIGDTTFDIEMGVNAGIATIGVEWGYHGTLELSAAGANRIVAHFDVLEAEIDALLGSGGER